MFYQVLHCFIPCISFDFSWYLSTSFFLLCQLKIWFHCFIWINLTLLALLLFLNLTCALTSSFWIYQGVAYSNPSYNFRIARKSNHVYIFWNRHLRMSTVASKQVRIIFRAFQLSENGNKNSIFYWVSKLSLDYQAHLKTMKILVMSNLLYRWCFSWFGAICRILKMWGPLLQKCYFSIVAALYCYFHFD